MSLIQPGIESVLTNLENMSTKKDGLSSKKIRAEAKIEFKEELLSKGETKCEQCGHITDGIELDQKEKEAKDVAELRAKVTELQTQIESLGDPSSSIVSLSKYRNPTGYSQLSEIEHTIAEKLMLTRTRTTQRKKILNELETHDMQAVAELGRRRTSLTEHIGSLKVERATAKKLHEEAVATRSKLEGKLPSEDDTPKIKEAVKMNEVYEWLSEGFMKAMDKYKEVARKSVELQSTNAFLAMVPEPKKYKKIAISKKWDVEVIGSNGKAKVIANPGHKQTLAVSIFDGLRKTSKHHFPTFFDNPGSNISDNILDRMVDYFWDEEIDQVVMLSHGGGLKRKETMENYGDRLARAWELSYVKGETLTQVKEIR